VPQRLQHVLDELARRPVGSLVQPAADLPLDAALRRVHSADYLDFLAHAWEDWVALDPANAVVDALPSVWPLASKHGFRTDVPPLNFAARLGQYAFDAGTPLMAGSWAAAREGAACALAAAQAVLGGERWAMALTRPPGHHAGPNYMGGYCFINNAAVAAQALRDGILPPTINFNDPDPQLTLDFIPNHARQQQVEYAMSNSFAFGGQNAVLLLKRWAK